MKNKRVNAGYRLMSTKIHFLIALAMLLCLVSSRTDGALIAVTDNASPGGVDNVTYDTATGLEWLDLTASGNISYDDITLQFAPAGTYDGWRHAIQTEVMNLIVNSAGLPLGGQSIVDPLATQFIGLVGVTQSNSFPNGTFARGIYNDDASGSIANAAGMAFVGFGTQTLVNSNYTDVSILNDQPFLKSAITASVGHWLVRTAVPEPATMALLGFGGLLIRRRKIRL